MAYSVRLIVPFPSYYNTATRFVQYTDTVLVQQALQP